MNIFTKTKIYFESYMAQRNDVPLKDLIQERAKTLARRAPIGRMDSYVSIQPDGSTLVTEMQEDNNDLQDRLILRDRMGDFYSDSLQRNATSAIENISRLDMDMRDYSESLREHRERQDRVLSETPDYYFAKREAMKNMFVFLAIAIGDIGALFILFSDFFGLDPTRISRELLKNFPSVITTAFFTIGFFAASLYVAEKALYSRERIIWLVGLAMIAGVIGKMRALQSTVMQEADFNSLLMTFLYLLIGFIFPLVAAAYAQKWREASQFTGQTDSVLKGLNELEATYKQRLSEINRNREDARKQLSVITEEYVTRYQEALAAKDNSRTDWEQYSRYVEAYLAEMRLAYTFWNGWMTRKLTH